jgi:hypothetical protein
MRTHSLSIAGLILVAATLSPAVRAADKLKGIYAGSGGFSADVHRVLFIEFAADGTALLQQKWHEKDPQTWHAHWKQEKKKITLTYEAAKDTAKDTPLPEPLIFNLKHGALVATSWDATTLGILGPPHLTPFGGQNPQVNSVAGCQSLNTLDPRRDCVTWGSNR